MNIQNGIVANWEGVPAAFFGDGPQAGSKRGRPFDFFYSIQSKCGQNMNENLRKFEMILKKSMRKWENKVGIILTCHYTLWYNTLICVFRSL